MLYTTLFFDLDDTLYDNKSGLWEAIKERMNLYMVKCLNLPPAEVPELRRKYYLSYGTTLRGLQIHHQVDTDDFLAYVHDLPLAEYLRPDPQLKEMLKLLPQQKWVFTNADRQHAQRVLAILEVADFFMGIIDVHALNFQSKPAKEAYWEALIIAGEPDPRQCVLLDDSTTNLVPAHQMGFTTVLVGENESNSSADYNIRRVHQLPQAIPGLLSDSRVSSSWGS
jgi:putative hydrolase of the HAD superfamily